MLLKTPLSLPAWTCLPSACICAFAGAALCLFVASTAQAQSPISAQNSAPGKDFIVAVVDTTPITNYEVRQRVPQLQAQRLQQGAKPLAEPAALKEALELLIAEKALLQLAKETGVTVEDEVLTQALQRQGASGAASGQDQRQALRDQLTLQRLTERNVPARVKVSEADINQALAERQNATLDKNPDLELGHILVAVPEKASAAEVAQLQAKAAEAKAQLQASGADLAKVAAAFSDSPERNSGGSMGLRSASRYPDLFVEAVRGLSVGEVSEVLRSGAGFHVLKLLDKRASSALTISQTHPRHILLRPSGSLSENGARAQLAQYKRLIETNKADFAALAREHSQDSSAVEGGDLGWVSPGMFVPEFERVMNQLPIGQIADPLVSRFGVHLIQVMARRDAPITERELRDMVRAELREKKAAPAYELWAQEVRGRAYVEYRDSPQ